MTGRFRGPLASNWQGGINSFPYSKEWTKWLRREIKNRDHHQCQNPSCDKTTISLDVHHVDYKKTNNNPDNLITICKKCHGLTQHNRPKWISYYQELMKRVAGVN